MRCPQCGARETRVVDSRDLDDAATIRRRRECSACSSRFTTYERVEAARLVVVKRDGSRQEFDRDRLTSGLRKALTRRPVPDGAAEAAAEAIEAELRAAGVTEIPSSRIGALAMEQLRGTDQIAYNRYAFIDVRAPQPDLTELLTVADDEPFILHPGEFVLGQTHEWVELPNDLVARLEGKSSLGRLGLLIHSTAGYVDPGWKGNLTL